MTKIKILILILLSISLSSCSLPFQSDLYPAWKTNGIVTTDNDNGFMGLYVGEIASTTDFDITVESFNHEGNTLTANIKIVNKTKNKKNLKYNYFPLMWNLGTDNEGYTYPSNSEETLIISSNEEVNLTLEYNCDENCILPYAIYYGEVYSNTDGGNSYYFYLK